MRTTEGPLALERCIGVLQAHTGQLPGVFPPHLHDAARWWISEMSEPPHAVCDQARELSVAGDSEKKRMLYPYIDRLAYCLRRFLALPGPYQIEIVIGVTEGRVPWRGDAIAMYRLIGKEAARAREVGIDEYRKDARAMAKGAIKKMT